MITDKSIYLPTFRVFPIEIQSFESVIVHKDQGVFNKSASGCWIVDHSTVFASLRIIPASQGDQHLDAVTLECRHFGVEFWTVFISVRPRVEYSHDQLIRIQSSESVKNMGAEIQVNITWSIFSFTLAIPRPVGIITDDFIIFCMG